jgi:hypothetical protein
MDHDEQKARMKQMVDGWKTLTPFLEHERRVQIRSTVTSEAMSSLSEFFDYAVQSRPPRPSSGLVELQRLLATQRARRA